MFIGGTAPRSLLPANEHNAGLGMARTMRGTVDIVDKKDIRDDDIIEAKARRRKGLYDDILNQNWEAYESKSHEGKDDFARDVVEEMMERGIRFLSKTKDPVTGEDVFHMNREVTFQFKQKVKRDIKMVVNENHARLGLTRKQIEERKQMFKQQRDEQSDKQGKVDTAAVKSAQRQLSLSSHRTKPNEQTQRNPHVPHARNIHVRANFPFPPASAFECVAKTYGSGGSWVGDQRKRYVRSCRVGT